jgi:menaquinol-cytochrome c reductase iron-sulfur subunit
LATNGESGNGKRKLPKAAPAGTFEGESMNRRAALMVGGQVLAGGAIAVVALPTIGFALAPVFKEKGDFWQSVGSVDQYSADEYTATVITAVEGTGESGKTTAYVRLGNEELKEDPNSVVAVSTRCAHLGCAVRFVAAAGNFICPCHGGVYGFQGERIGGPPVRPLDRFQTRVRDGEVEIGPRYSVTNSFEPVRARDPGEFTGGVWNVIYPPRPSVPPAP